MRLIRQLNFQTRRGASFGDLWTLVAAQAAARPELFGATVFYLEDLPGSAQSGYEQVVKAIPALAPYLRVPGRDRPGRSLTNSPALVEDKAPPRPLDADAAERLARGIPRRFPGRFALLMRCWAPEVAPSPSADPPQPLRLATTQPRDPLHLGLQVIRRVDELWLVALVDLGLVPPTCSAVPAPPADVQPLLASLGEVAWETLIVVPSIEERRHLEATAREVAAAIRSWNQSVTAARATPGKSAFRPGAGGKPVSLNYKSGLVKGFRDAGFRYDAELSQPRFHVLSRRSSRGHVTEVIADIGGTGRPSLVSIQVGMRGPGWETERILLVPQRPVAGEEEWSALLSTARSQLQAFERELLPHLDGAFPQTPDWYAAAARVTFAGS